MAASTFFDVYGPEPIARDQSVCAASQTDLWAALEAQTTGLSEAIGCYLFCIRNGKKITPWYVGMTVAHGGFQSEVFQQHKRDIYAECLVAHRGEPVLFLFPLTNKSYDLSRARSSGKKVIAWLEKTLMGMAFTQNPDISNVRDMTFLKNVEVLGLMGPRRGRPHTEVQQIRRTLLGTGHK